MRERARARLAEQRVAVAQQQCLAVAHDLQVAADRHRGAQGDLDRAVAAEFAGVPLGQQAADIAAIARQAGAVEARRDDDLVHSSSAARKLQHPPG
jgi:hypothetical protein